jgi:hypothetical protein
MASTAGAQTLTMGVIAGPESIDPHFTATGTHSESLKHVFDTLTHSGDRLQVEPGLAESWRIVNPTTWEFRLRRGVKFHDGSDMTAEDLMDLLDERLTLVTVVLPHQRDLIERKDMLVLPYPLTSIVWQRLHVTIWRCSEAQMRTSKMQISRVPSFLTASGWVVRRAILWGRILG